MPTIFQAQNNQQAAQASPATAWTNAATQLGSALSGGQQGFKSAETMVKPQQAQPRQQQAQEQQPSQQTQQPQEKKEGGGQDWGMYSNAAAAALLAATGRTDLFPLLSYLQEMFKQQDPNNKDTKENPAAVDPKKEEAAAGEVVGTPNPNQQQQPAAQEQQVQQMPYEIGSPENDQAILQQVVNSLNPQYAPLQGGPSPFPQNPTQLGPYSPLNGLGSALGSPMNPMMNPSLQFAPNQPTQYNPSIFMPQDQMRGMI